MKLILIRHAKSSWKENVKDFNRGLAHRGIEDIQLVFSQFEPNFFDDFDVFSSDAERTKQTAYYFAMKTSFDYKNIQFSKDLYTFDCRELEKFIHTNSSKNMIIFGHNNAITDFVNKFGNYYMENVPTCGVVILNFENDIFEKNKRGTIQKTIFPRDFK